MFGLIPLIESFFFLSLGITFILIFLMVFHFKQRIEKLERNNNDLSDLCNKIVKEVTNLHTVYLHSQNQNQNQNSTKNYYPKENIVISTSNYSQDNVVTDENFKKIIVMDNIGELDFSDDLDETDDLEETDDLDELEETDDLDGDNQTDISEDGEDVEDIDLDHIEEKDIREEEKDIGEENIQVLKKSEELYEDDILPKKTNEKSNFQKMNVQDLKILAISRGVCSDTTKMKKADIIKLLEEEEESQQKV